MDPKPIQLILSVETFDGPQYHVRLENGTLRYDSLGSGYIPEKENTVPVSNEQWQKFRTELDNLNVWDWQEEYYLPVLDGMSWEFEAVYSDRRVKCQGSNCYPTSDGCASKRPEPTKAFQRLQEAVERLVGV